MATFVGPEYIIANILMAMNKKLGKRSISMEELNCYSEYIQEKAKGKDLSAIFLSSKWQLFSAAFNFSDYFEYNPENEEVSLKNGVMLSDLESRFIGYLPFDVLKFIFESANEIV